jgi:putative endonuclease
MKTYYVYIVLCSDGSYYTGVTNNIEVRLAQHNQGTDEACYTYSRRPVNLKYYEPFNNIKQAIAREKQIKGWSRRKKQALILQDWDKLVAYSQRKKLDLGAQH